MRRDRRVRRLLCMLCAIACAVVMIMTAAHAKADAPQVVRVGYYENEVFQEGASDGAIKNGYAYEYYRKMSEYTGWEYEYVYGDFATLYDMLLSGDVDLLAGLAWREDRVGLVGYPKEAMGNETYNLVKHDTDDSVTVDPATLAGKRIGVLDSAVVNVLEDYLAMNNVDAQVVPYRDYEELFDAFDRDEVDILAAEGDGAYGRNHAEVTTSFGTSDYYLCVSINRPDLLEELDVAQAELAANEPTYLSGLRSKYYPVSMTSRAFSPAEKEWLSTHDTLSVGYLNNYLPYCDTDSNGQVTGLVKDLLPKMLQDMGISGISVNYHGFDSYDEMVAAVCDGGVDAIFPVGGGLYYSEESGIYQSNAVASSSTELVFKGEMRDSSSARFAVNERNRMQYYYVLTNFPDAEVVQYPSIDDCLQAVLSGEVDCTTLNGLRANEILKNRAYRGLSLRQLSKADDRCFGVRIGNEGLLKLLNRGINVVGQEYVQNLGYRYAENLSTYDLIDVLRDNMALFGSAIMAMATFVIILLARDSRRSKQRATEQEQARVELEEKNRELAESKEALSDALVVAESANRAKTDFLNSVSHDIRTPMNAIVGFTTLASTHLGDQALVKSYLDKISVSSKHLLALINDVLDMSRIESGQLIIEPSDVHLPDLIEDIRTIVSSDVEVRQQHFTVNVGELITQDVVSDRLRLTQVLLNILSNAVKFTPNGGYICLDVAEHAGEDSDTVILEFRVTDSGIGMSEEFQEHLFEPFARERTSTVSGVQGTGLGMAITKSVVDMLGGTISVASTVGEGTVFVVCIPCVACEAKSATEDETNTVDFHGKRVLLVEDSVVNQEIAKTILSEAGFVVDVVDDGSFAVEQMDAMPAGTYDVVLMDIQMPMMDGYEATRRIRALDDPAKAQVPIIAVTANAFEEDKNNSIAVGMDAHLAKPYDIPKMMDTLAQVLGL